MYQGALYTLISPGSERNLSTVAAGLDSDISARDGRGGGAQE